MQSRGFSEIHAMKISTQGMVMTREKIGSHFGHLATSIEAPHASNNTPSFFVVEKSSKGKQSAAPGS